jgi:hypothetical protein
MRRLVVIQHKVEGIRGCADENDFEYGIVQTLRQVECPQKIDVSSHINDKVEDLRFKRDARRTLY